MAKYDVSFQGQSYEIDEDEYILDSLENQGVDTFPYSCRAGSCIECLCVLGSGGVDQSDGTMLTKKPMDTGLVLVCDLSVAQFVKKSEASLP